MSKTQTVITLNPSILEMDVCTNPLLWYITKVIYDDSQGKIEQGLLTPTKVSKFGNNVVIELDLSQLENVKQLAQEVDGIEYEEQPSLKLTIDLEAFDAVELLGVRIKEPLPPKEIIWKTNELPYKPLVEQWLAYRKKQYKNPRIILNQLIRLSRQRIDIAQQIVDQSISKGWKGLFPVRQNYSKRVENLEIPPNVKPMADLLTSKQVKLTNRGITYMQEIQDNTNTCVRYYTEYLRKDHPFIDKCPTGLEYLRAMLAWMDEQAWISKPLSESCFAWGGKLNQKFLQEKAGKIWGSRVMAVMSTKQELDNKIKSAGRMSS